MSIEKTALGLELSREQQDKIQKEIKSDIKDLNDAAQKKFSTTPKEIVRAAASEIVKGVATAYIFEIKEIEFHPTEQTKELILFKYSSINKFLEVIKESKLNDFTGTGPFKISFEDVAKLGATSFLYVLDGDSVSRKSYYKFSALLQLGTLEGKTSMTSELSTGPFKNLGRGDLKLIIPEVARPPYTQAITGFEYKATGLNKTTGMETKFETTDFMNNIYEITCVNNDVLKKYVPPLTRNVIEQLRTGKYDKMFSVE